MLTHQLILIEYVDNQKAGLVSAYYELLLLIEIVVLFYCTLYLDIKYILLCRISYTDRDTVLVSWCISSSLVPQASCQRVWRCLQRDRWHRHNTLQCGRTQPILPLRLSSGSCKHHRPRPFQRCGGGSHSWTGPLFTSSSGQSLMTRQCHEFFISTLLS